MGDGGSSGFRQGVKDTTSLPIVFINPAEFHREHFLKTREVHPDDIIKARGVIQQQGVDSAGFTDKQIAILVKRSFAGPFGHAMEVNDLSGKAMRICLANGPEGSIEQHNDTLLKQAKIDLSKVSAIPGWEQHRERLFGIHEGTHCNQDMNTKGMSEEKKDIFLLGREAEGDRAAVNWARQNNLQEVAQALIDIRALGALEGDDPRHATAILIDRPDIVASQQHIDAARDFKFQMVIGLSENLHISLDDAVDMFVRKRELFIGHIDKLLAKGAFNPTKNSNLDNNPFIEDYIRAYAGAYRRQIIERPINSPVLQAPQQPAPQQPAQPKSPHTSLEIVEKGDSLRLASNNDTSKEEGISLNSSAFEASEDLDNLPAENIDKANRLGVPIVTFSSEGEVSIRINGMRVEDYWAKIAEPSQAQESYTLLNTSEEIKGFVSSRTSQNSTVSQVRCT